jgi:Zn-dependent alcohol dehydrogenase
MSLFCRRCSYCLSGRPHLCTREGALARFADDPGSRIGDVAVTAFCEPGSFSEEMIVHERGLAKIPPVVGETDFVDASDGDAVGTVLAPTSGGVDRAIDAAGSKPTTQVENRRS